MVSDDQHNGQSGRVDWMEVFNTVTTFILLNLLWLFGSLFIVTLPAVTAALFATVAPWARGQAVYQPFVTFWAALKSYWLKATAVALIDLIAAGIVAANLYILWQMDLQQFVPLLALIATMLLLIFLILGNVYFWPLLVTFDQPLSTLLKNTLKLTISHPLWGLLTAVAAVTPLVLSLFLPGVFILTVSFATPALITNWGAWRVIRRYLDKNDLQNLGV